MASIKGQCLGGENICMEMINKTLKQCLCFCLCSIDNYINIL